MSVEYDIGNGERPIPTEKEKDMEVMGLYEYTVVYQLIEVNKTLKGIEKILDNNYE